MKTSAVKTPQIKRYVRRYNRHTIKATLRKIASSKK